MNDCKALCETAGCFFSARKAEAMYAFITKTSEKWNGKSGETNKLNTDWLFETNNEYGFPEVASSPNFSADDLLPFHMCKSRWRVDEHLAPHFFLDDYKFEQLWTKPQHYIKMFQAYGNMVSPDFSVWSVQPYA